MTFPHPLCTRCGYPLDGIDHDGYRHDHCRGFWARLLGRKSR